MKEATISLYHDTRRVLDDGNYPVKLRVYFGIAKLFETGSSLSKEEFERAYNEPRPRGRYKEIQVELKAIESRAAEIIKNLPSFSFDRFKRELYRNKTSVNNIIDHYNDYITELGNLEKEGTKSNYQCSINSIKSFVNQGRKNPVTQIGFDKINPSFLNKYENWMIESGNSRTTVGIYLRPLRKIFNAAIETRDIAPELYPFKQYKIPTGKNTKKNLESDVLKSLYTADLQNDCHQEKARDFWFFSYQCNCMFRR
ncbi:phage integrase SAM-like domain-containing protein [Pedobacter panaciterrae]|uniref:Phage integrase SAM-like domain-containing protein n=2 Tax=Bacteria TaxID=2 RepID=A0ABU8NTA6_9SPHI